MTTESMGALEIIRILDESVLISTFPFPTRSGTRLAGDACLIKTPDFFLDMELRGICDVASALLLVTLSFLGEGHSHSHPHSHSGSQGHGHPTGEKPSGLHDPKVSQDKEHIMEHYEGQAKLNESDMSAEELEFHYFKLHDFDNNTMLDGLEIYKALSHLMPYEPDEDMAKLPPAQLEIEKQKKRAEQAKHFIDIVDTVLEEDDIDNDGYLTYLEYVLARKREEARQKMEEQEEHAKHSRGGRH